MNAERVVLYLHGGGFFICNRKTHRMLTWRVSKFCKARLLVIDYRLSPEAVFPLALHDALSSYIYLTKTKGYRPDQVVVMGDSSGGGLTFSMMVWLRDNAHLGYGMPAGTAMMSPWLDLTHSMPSFKVHGCYDFLPSSAKDPKYINETRGHYVREFIFKKSTVVSNHGLVLIVNLPRHLFSMYPQTIC